MCTETIHVAYCKRGGKRDPHYFAVAGVLRPFDTRQGAVSHSIYVKSDDTPELAIEDVLRAIADSYRRLGIDPPKDIVQHGKLPTIDVESRLFLRRLESARP